MATCKTCGTKVSIWSGRNDGLCNECGAKADEATRQDAARREAERKRRVEEEARKAVDSIVRAMTTEAPLSYTFIVWNIEEKKSGGFVGSIVGGVLGGAIGAAIGGALAGPSSHTGELGILVLTRNQILVGHFTAPLPSAEGTITPDHLSLFQAQFAAKTLSRKAFDIGRTQVSRSPNSDSELQLASGAQTLSFRTCVLYVDDVPYALPSISEIQDRIAQLGALATPADFAAKLLRGESPLPDSQFHEVEKDQAYLSAIFHKVLTHQKRDELLGQFACLAPAVRAFLEGKIQSLGSSVRGTRTWLVVWSALAGAAIIGICLTEDFLCFLFVVGALAFLIASIVSAVRLSRAKWCEKAC